MNFTAAQARAAVDLIIKQGKTISRCTLGGGEPLLNKELPEIINEFDRLPGLKRGRVLTNGQQREGPRLSIQLPKRWKWITAPIVDPSNPKSGKAEHVPFFVSPKDHGIYSAWKFCTVKGFCGKGLDAYGFSMCGVAATLARLLGINPYWQDGPQLMRKQEEICAHCPYGIQGNSRSERRANQRKLTDAAMRGEIPAISKTFQEGLKRHREQPMEFERFAEKELHQIEV
jgi:hypothetical protein